MAPTVPWRHHQRSDHILLEHVSLLKPRNRGIYLFSWSSHGRHTGPKPTQYPLNDDGLQNRATLYVTFMAAL